MTPRPATAACGARTCSPRSRRGWTSSGGAAPRRRASSRCPTTRWSPSTRPASPPRRYRGFRAARARERIAAAGLVAVCRCSPAYPDAPARARRPAGACSTWRAIRRCCSTRGLGGAVSARGAARRTGSRSRAGSVAASPRRRHARGLGPGAGRRLGRARRRALGARAPSHTGAPSARSGRSRRGAARRGGPPGPGASGRVGDDVMRPAARRAARCRARARRPRVRFR